ncbi:hypothetical protein AVEN_206465-1 [Araneus ventricosus]|uniref:Secreted protein n=1 Tax=Araneus ventricosus TaxID=182803 RepID=A0A4Y2FX73_ARAVE|nr:hypothetical protein AVEN_206465-1 [Araneus ventricosus]
MPVTGCACAFVWLVAVATTSRLRMTLAGSLDVGNTAVVPATRRAATHSPQSTETCYSAVCKMFRSEDGAREIFVRQEEGVVRCPIRSWILERRPLLAGTNQ